jgi:hypothetical protein
MWTGYDNFKSSEILIWIRKKKSDVKLRFHSAAQTAYVGTLLSSRVLRGQTLKLTSQLHSLLSSNTHIPGNTQTRR